MFKFSAPTTFLSTSLLPYMYQKLSNELGRVGAMRKPPCAPVVQIAVGAYTDEPGEGTLEAVPARITLGPPASVPLPPSGRQLLLFKCCCHKAAAGHPGTGQQAAHREKPPRNSWPCRWSSTLLEGCTNTIGHVALTWQGRGPYGSCCWRSEAGQAQARRGRCRHGAKHLPHSLPQSGPQRSPPPPAPG